MLIGFISRVQNIDNIKEIIYDSFVNDDSFIKEFDGDEKKQAKVS